MSDPTEIDFCRQNKHLLFEKKRRTLIEQAMFSG